MDVGLAVRASPERARSLLTVRAAIYSAVSSERPWSSRPSLMCSYWRSRLLLHACCGMVHLLLFLRHREPSLRSRSTPVVLPAHLRQMRLRGMRLGYLPAIERPGERTTQGRIRCNCPSKWTWPRFGRSQCKTDHRSTASMRGGPARCPRVGPSFPCTTMATCAGRTAPWSGSPRSGTIADSSLSASDLLVHGPRDLDDRAPGSSL